VAGRLSGGKLVIAGTPLGNPGDASDRLRRTLTDADVIAAEDTRRTRRLMADLDVATRADLVALHEHNELERAESLVALARAGSTVVLVSDAGMPTISDPGYRLVGAAIAADVPVTVIPGASAVIAALAVSGLPTDRFTFEGFLPRRSGRRSAALTALAKETRTMVFFESPRRTEATLAAMVAAFGVDRPAALCRELTKTYEEVQRGTLAALHEHVSSAGVLGEVTLVVGGAPRTTDTMSTDQLAQQVADLCASGISQKQAIGQVATLSGVPKREVYQAVIDARRGHEEADPPKVGRTDP
jgi:16S rRNA (cytidine1402-2'-O)-methyltransferase